MYTLFSGLNVATVGAIAFAAVQPATKAITDPHFRVIVVFSACAGLFYNFPDKYCCVGSAGNKVEKTDTKGRSYGIDWCNLTARR